MFSRFDRTDDGIAPNVWITQDGQRVFIDKMTDTHLHNCILHIERVLVDRPALTFLREKKERMEAELKHRGLPLPLIPITTLDARRGKKHDYRKCDKQIDAS